MRQTAILSILFLTLVSIFSRHAHADIAVGILPFKGEHPKKTEIELRVKEHMQKCKGISIVADTMMKDIINIHEKAQAFGSAYHDISKLKTAEYLIVGSFEELLLGLKAIDVNSGTEVTSKTVNLSLDSGDSLIRSSCKLLYDSILLHSSSRNEEIPELATPYMNILNRFVESLKSTDEDSFQFLALYYKGKYQQPIKDDAYFTSMAKTFIRAARPNLINSKVSFVFLDEESPWTNVIVVTDRKGKKQKHKFGFIDREDGSFGIGLYEPQN